MAAEVSPDGPVSRGMQRAVVQQQREHPVEAGVRLELLRVDRYSMPAPHTRERSGCSSEALRTGRISGLRVVATSMVAPRKR